MIAPGVALHSKGTGKIGYSGGVARTLLLSLGGTGGAGVCKSIASDAIVV
jgi:hypothetical protein